MLLLVPLQVIRTPCFSLFLNDYRHSDLIFVHYTDTSRLFLANAEKYTPAHLTLVLDLVRLSTNTYADVRKKAQSSMCIGVSFDGGWVLSMSYTMRVCELAWCSVTHHHKPRRLRLAYPFLTPTPIPPAISSAMRCFPSAKYDIFPCVLEYLDPQSPVHNDESVKGAVYILQSRSFLHMATHSWDYMSSFLLNLMKYVCVL